jgi:hypothetical protein
MKDIMKSILSVLIVIFISGALSTIAGAATELSNSGGGTWKYQREISIKENSGTMLTDYQVLIELKGADFPNEAKSDGADVRFTDSNGNELNYWIESWDYAGKSAKMWVKIPNMIESGSVVIGMLSGNPKASSTSSFDYTFISGNNDFESETSGTSHDAISYWEHESGTMGENAGWYEELISSSSPCSESLSLSASRRYSGGKSVYSYIKNCNTGGNHNKNTRSSANRIFNKDSYRFVANSNILHLWITNVDYETSSRWRWDIGVIISDATNTQNTRLVCRDWGNQEGCPNDAYDNFDQTATGADGTIWKRYSISIPSNYNKANLFLKIVHHQDSWDGTTADSGVYYDLIDSNLKLRKYSSSEPTVTLAPPKSSSVTVTKSASPYSIRQFQETTIKISIENSGISDVKAIEVMDSIHPSFDLVSGDFPNPKKYDIIRAGESRELQYTIRAKESGTFTLDPAIITYADKDGNIQEVKSEPVSIKVVPSSEGVSGTPSGQPSKLSASVSLTGEKTDVILGEDILLKLSAVNLITKPKMRVQVIIIPPSGMSVTSSEFSKSGTNQFTANYELEPGDGKDIGVGIKPNQIGDFNVNGRIIYYFGDEKDKAVDQTLNLPIKVRKEIASTPAQNSIENPAQKPIPGFGMIIGIGGLLFTILLKRKR